MKNVTRDKLFFSLLIIFTSFYNDSFACRYTVREIGFSDIGTDYYHLYFFTDSRTPVEQVVTLRNFSDMLLRDSNVRLVITGAYKNDSPEVSGLIKKHNIQVFPSAVFVGPGGESVICHYSKAGKSPVESSLILLESIVSSSFRDEIAGNLIRTYGIVLIIEGADASANKKVWNDAGDAVRSISGSLTQMPKAVNEPPVIMVLPHNMKNEEEILLFGLGITGKDNEDTHVAILYGRGKLAGPVLKGEQITARRLYNLLTLIGADCECGIDNSWITGKTIPFRWGPTEQAALTKHLGFDVENPVVKTEMSHIISLKSDLENPVNPLDENLLEFEERSFQMTESRNTVPKITAVEIQKSFSQNNGKENGLTVKKTLLSLAAIFASVIIITGLSLFMFKRRDNKK